MNKKINQLAPEILAEVKKAKHILLNCHRGPDGDSLGGSLSMHLFLKSLGKKVTHIKGDSELPEYLASLPGYNLIQKKNYFEVDLSKIDLFITIDTAGLNQISRLKEVTFPKNLKVIVIDHHKSNPKYGDINLVDDSAVAACQVLFYLYKSWGVKITKEMAANLFVGLYTDSGGFKYSLVSSNTLKAAAELVEINPDFYKYIFEIENSLQPSYLTFQALAINNIKTFFNGKVAVSAISNKELEKNKLIDKEWSPSDIANSLKAVKGWEIGICMTEKDKGLYGISFRTRDAKVFDVSKVASLLGGGGHAAAAGAPIMAKSKTTAIKKLTKALRKSYPELEKVLK